MYLPIQDLKSLMDRDKDPPDFPYQGAELEKWPL